MKLKTEDSLERQESEPAPMKDGDAEKEWQKRKRRGQTHGDGINNRENESEITEGCEGWVVKA